MKQYTISYYLGNNIYHSTKFKGTKAEAKEYAQAYRLKKHLAPRQIILMEK